MLILEGLKEGEVAVYDKKEKLLKKYELIGDKMFKRVTISIKGETKVILSSPEKAVWEVHYDKGTELKIYDPKFINLPYIYPRAYCALKRGAKQIRLKLKMEGEGFHKAIIYEPRGRIVSVGEKFIDLGDTNIYEMEIRAPLKEGEPREGWAIELYGCDVLEAEGLSPFLSLY